MATTKKTTRNKQNSGRSRAVASTKVGKRTAKKSLKQSIWKKKWLVLAAFFIVFGGIGLYKQFSGKAYTGCATGSPILQYGSRGTCVTYMQRVLVGLGYLAGSEWGDGIFGSNTKAAVIKLQTVFDGSGDGVVGPRTWNMACIKAKTLSSSSVGYQAGILAGCGYSSTSTTTSPPPPTTTTPPPSPTPTTSSARTYAQQIVSSGRVSGSSTYWGQITAIANGSTSCYINPTLLQQVARMASLGYRMYISSLNRTCSGVYGSAYTSTSWHYTNNNNKYDSPVGSAVDFTYINGSAVSSGNRTTQTNFVNSWFAYAPSGHYYQLGQSSCGLFGSLNWSGKSVSYYSDSCNHIHMGVR